MGGIGRSLPAKKKVAKTSTSNGSVRNNLVSPKNWSYWWQKGLLGVSLVALLTLLFLFPFEKSLDFSDWEVGKPAEEEVIADFTFPVLKNEAELKREKEVAKGSVPPVIRLDEELSESKIAELDSFFLAIEGVGISSNPDSVVAEAVSGRSLQLSEEAIAVLVDNERQKMEKGGSQGQKRWRRGGTPVGLKVITRDLVSKLLRKGIIDDRNEVVGRSQGKVTVVSGSGEKVVPLEELYDLKMAKEELLNLSMARFPNKNELVKGIYELGVAFLAPNLSFDEEETVARRTEAAEEVPLIRGHILKDERIIDSHEIVTARHKNILRSYAIAKADRELQVRSWKILYPVLGRVLTISMLLSVLGMFLYAYRPRVYAKNSLLLMLAIIIVVPLLVTSFISSQPSLSEYFIPIAIASILVTVLFDAELGMVSTIVIALLIGAMRGYEFSISLVSIICGTVAVFSVRRVRHRNHFYRSLLYVPLAYAVSIVTLNLLRFTPFEEMITQVGAGVANGFLSPILSIGLLPIFESTFNVTTDISLLELSDLNRPILKKLAIKAPGTYHHSIVIGNLAEAAAEAIGANSLLARVSAYYHDIGKIEKSSYFVENQRGVDNKHEKLTPRMSSLILASHVRDGNELADRERLPQVIKDIIQQHHGTSLMTFFYQKALDLAGDEKLEESNFRYPGPRPQTKEAGIVMLADSIEAATRTLKDANPNRVKGLVHKIIENKFGEGELDECELTLRNLTKIAESFLPILVGIFHPRVEYPEREEAAAQPKEKRLVSLQK